MKIGETPVLTLERFNWRDSFETPWVCPEYLKEMFSLGKAQSIVCKAYTHRMQNSRPIRVKLFLGWSSSYPYAYWTHTKTKSPNDVLFWRLEKTITDFFKGKTPFSGEVKTIWVTVMDAKTKKTLPPKKKGNWG